MDSSLGAFQKRLLIAIGTLPVLTGCGGKVVYVLDDGDGGGSTANGDGAGGAPTVPSSGGAGGEPPSGGAPGFCPGHEGEPTVCAQTFEGCPPAASEEAWQLVKGTLEQDQSCTDIPELCWCTANISDIPCGPDPSALQCCYVVSYTIEEQCEGRPFVVGESARVAPFAPRADWSTELSMAMEGLPAEAREALAEIWLRRAQFEHASVASFARFTLDLLAVGAPAELVASSVRAAADEVEHARICFGVAGAFAGRGLGPGELAVEGALEGRRTLADIAASAVVEGCVGETCAALEARAASRGVECPVLAALASRIADDEEVHAELAWRFVAWACQRGGADVRAAVLRAFREPPSFAVEASALSETLGHRFGVRTASEQRATREQVWREVIAPLRDALVSSDRGERSPARAAAT